MIFHITVGDIEVVDIAYDRVDFLELLMEWRKTNRSHTLPSFLGDTRLCAADIKIEGLESVSRQHQRVYSSMSNSDYQCELRNFSADVVVSKTRI